jgi:hypothetical protein
MTRGKRGGRRLQRGGGGREGQLEGCVPSSSRCLPPFRPSSLLVPAPSVTSIPAAAATVGRNRTVTVRRSDSSQSRASHLSRTCSCSAMWRVGEMARLAHSGTSPRAQASAHVLNRNASNTRARGRIPCCPLSTILLALCGSARRGRALVPSACNPDSYEESLIPISVILIGSGFLGSAIRQARLSSNNQSWSCKKHSFAFALVQASGCRTVEYGCLPVCICRCFRTAVLPLLLRCPAEAPRRRGQR